MKPRFRAGLLGVSVKSQVTGNVCARLGRWVLGVELNKARCAALDDHPNSSYQPQRKPEDAVHLLLY
jgi:hypothetical protein